MFSNVGNPSFGSGGQILTSPTQSSQAAGRDSAASARGEAAAANIIALSSERVDPTRQSGMVRPEFGETRKSAPAANPLTGVILQEAARVAERSRGPNPEGGQEIPEPEGLSGPPPTFDRSVLQARREEVLAASEGDTSTKRVDQNTEEQQVEKRESPVETQAPLGQDATAQSDRPSESQENIDPVRRVAEATAPIDVPPAREQRAEAEFEGFKRLNDAPGREGIDLTR